MELNNEIISKIFSRQLMSLPLGNIRRGEKNEKRWNLLKEN